MPMYRIGQSELDAEIARLEHAGEVITQVMADPESLDDFIIITALVNRRPVAPQKEVRVTDFARGTKGNAIEVDD